MFNEWRENIWLMFELFIILIAVWIFCIRLLSSIINYFQPKGFDITDVYHAEIGLKYTGDAGQIDYGEYASARNGEDLLRMLNRYRNNRYVEYAGLTYNCTPYVTAWYGTHLYKSEDSTSMPVNYREVTPDVAQILKFESLSGETPEELADLLRKGDMLVAPSDEFINTHDPHDLLNTPLYFGHNKNNTYYSHALIRPLIRHEFEKKTEGNAIIGWTDEMIAKGEVNYLIGSLLIKIKPGADKQFMDMYGSDKSLRDSGNAYVLTPMSLKDIRNNMMAPYSINFRIFIGATVFLIIIVFLGLLGTFRYRVSLRESEIAVRKVNGATAGDILRRLLSEGLILLCIAAIPAVVLAVIYDYRNPDYEFSQYIYPAGAVAFVILMLTVIAGILIPGILAMKIEPATALRDE